MKNIFTSLFLLLSLSLSAQVVADFEIFNTGQDSFLNGSDMSGGFQNGNVFLPNTYTVFPTFTAWEGWAISSVIDTTDISFMNQYASITGGGYDGSDNYAVFYAFNPQVLRLTGDAAGEEVSGFYITNGTYPYLVMRDGNSAAKKFGGVTGDDEDYFFITIRAYLNGTLSTDSVDFYLADFRFADNSQDYILDEWTWLDLSSLGKADSLSFQFTSSDVGNYGINTPTYFCVDNITTAGQPVSTYSPALSAALRLYPNPATESLWLDWQEEAAQVLLYNLSGQLLLEGQIEKGQNQLDVQQLPAGMYLLKVVDAEGNWANRKVVME